MPAKRRTRYQMTHAPVRVSMNFCTGTELDSSKRFCATCERPLKRRVSHYPRINGSFGWTAHYGDGSTRELAPGGVPDLARPA